MIRRLCQSECVVDGPREYLVGRVYEECLETHRQRGSRSAGLGFPLEQESAKNIGDFM